MHTAIRLPAWARPVAPLHRPSGARVHDSSLGGHDFAVDRQGVWLAGAIPPDSPSITPTNRTLLRRAVGFLVGVGSAA